MATTAEAWIGRRDRLPRNWSWGKKRKSGYRSGAEEKLAEYLTEQGTKFEYESLKLEYKKKVRSASCDECGGSKVSQKHIYTPDFILDNETIIEYKGRLTQTDRSKLLAVARSNPGVRIKLLFGANNKLAKNNNKRYSQWATENGFDYALEVPPRRWLRSSIKLEADNDVPPL